MKKKKPTDLEVTSLPPGLVVVRNKDPELLAAFFESFSEEEVEELTDMGYFLMGAESSFTFEQLTDADLKAMGLKRVKKTKKKSSVH